jgi:hypothetical protein
MNDYNYAHKSVLSLCPALYNQNKLNVLKIKLLCSGGGGG